MITAALNPEIEYQELIEQTECKKFTRLFQGEFLDDNNPEGYKTNKDWMRIDKI